MFNLIVTAQKQFPGMNRCGDDDLPNRKPCVSPTPYTKQIYKLTKEDLLGLKMSRKEREIDRLYDMLSEGHIPKPLKILLILVSLFFGPILALIDQISEKTS
ncbi:hypothetical protein AKJ63_00605 [candidate division MSBL1 archaeon SCGC-AAA259D18]|uniref:Uncharacterized protein n=1 Tax=candidate division MSBL1 archaeon SCGC-AAA259D18 TaxID=1698262 RepID=A0A133UCG2_9EURY|nr:hypothetical protein AKJ63_00605 [candidate division MSBL1 archaeon SCGC-AAA259D18]